MVRMRISGEMSQAQVGALTRWLYAMGIPAYLLHEPGDDRRLPMEPDGLALLAPGRLKAPENKSAAQFDARAAVDCGGVRLGGGHFEVIAGPCAVESEEQIVSLARRIKAAGATLLRGGAFKPRTSPYDFQGLHAQGLKMLVTAKQETGLPIVSEITSAADIALFEQVDIIQVGARNMQNYDLLRELGRTDKVIMLKRGLCATLEELLMSAEYILSGGNTRVILCERGIRTFEPATRNTLDLSAVPALQGISPLPVAVDPSHATGRAELVAPMALAAVAAGADALMIEVHGDPQHALSDGAQALTPDAFDALMVRVRALRSVLVP